jgi:hypothetical protein
MAGRMAGGSRSEATGYAGGAEGGAEEGAGHDSAVHAMCNFLERLVWCVMCGVLWCCGAMEQQQTGGAPTAGETMVDTRTSRAHCHCHKCKKNKYQVPTKPSSA